MGAGKGGKGAAAAAAPWRVGGAGVPGLRQRRIPEGAPRTGRVPGHRCVWRSRVAEAVWPQFGRASRALGLTLCHGRRAQLVSGIKPRPGREAGGFVCGCGIC